jgi:predicted transcriptional regulator
MRLSNVDKKILRVIKNSKKPLSTYRIAKEAKVMWSTANSHCYKLKSMNLINNKLESSKFGSGEKVVWWIK